MIYTLQKMNEHHKERGLNNLRKKAYTCVMKTQPYLSKIETGMKKFYLSLSEKDSRRYTAMYCLYMSGAWMQRRNGQARHK